jgi:hypothetical protein
MKRLSKLLYAQNRDSGYQVCNTTSSIGAASGRPEAFVVQATAADFGWCEKNNCLISAAGFGRQNR